MAAHASSGICITSQCSQQSGRLHCNQVPDMPTDPGLFFLSDQPKKQAAKTSQTKSITPFRTTSVRTQGKAFMLVQFKKNSTLVH